MAKRNKSKTRRDLLIGILGISALYMGSRWWLSRPKPLVFEEMTTPKGFRRLTAGAVSAGRFDPFIGLDQSAPTPKPISDEHICETLFASQGKAVPVAYFFDHFCPNCRQMSVLLNAFVAQNAISVRRHEWPILGEASVVAARAVLAAELQNGAAVFKQRMARSGFGIDRQVIKEIATSAGLNGERLVVDMQSATVDRKLETTRALAETFQLFATPSIVVGRTLVVGTLTAGQLDQLIVAERTDPGACMNKGGT